MGILVSIDCGNFSTRYTVKCINRLICLCYDKELTMSHTVGIIGLGMIGENMLEEFLDHPSFSVLSSWDIDPQVRENILSRHPEALIVENCNQVFDDSEIELIYVATPPITHVKYGLKVIDLNKALFMEKPISIDLSEGKHLVEIATENKIRAAVNFVYGAGSVVNVLERAIQSNEIGQVRNIEIRYQFPSWPLPNQLSAINWITNKNTGGFIREMFSHHVYLTHRLFGPIEVYTTKISYPYEEVSAEDYVIARLQTGDIPVWFMGGIGSPQTPRTSDFTINGEYGSFRIREGHQLLFADEGVWNVYKLDSERSSVEARLDQLVNLVEGKETKLPTLEDGYEVQKVIEQMLAY